MKIIYLYRYPSGKDTKFKVFKFIIEFLTNGFYESK